MPRASRSRWPGATRTWSSWWESALADFEPLEDPQPEESRYRDLLITLAQSARKAGTKAVITGRWLSDTVHEMAPRLPIRDAAVISKHHDGLHGSELAQSMIRSSGNVSAAIGVAAGGLIAFQELSVAGAIAIPFELAAETALVVLVELKLVTELHEIAGQGFTGTMKERSAAALRSWLSGRHITAVGLMAPGRADLLSRATRARLRQQVRRRFTRNLTTLGPLMTGAAIAAWLNRRATLDVGRRVAKDLGL